VEVRPGEAGVMLIAFAYFFCVMAGYFMLKPLREQMGIVGGVRNLPWLFLATFVTTLVMSPLFAVMVTALPRRRFIPLVYWIVLASLLFFYLLFAALDGAGLVYTARAFFVWVSVFNLFVVSVFWGFMADLFHLDQAKRLFGFIGAGGTLGAIAGSALTTSLVQARWVRPIDLLLIAALLIAGAVWCVRWLTRLLPVDAGRAESGPVVVASLLSGVRLVVRSPYLRGICIYLLLYTHMSTVLYLARAAIVDASLADRAHQTAYFASIDFGYNVLTVLLQLTLTGRIIRTIGLGWSLASVGLVCLTGFALLGLAPGLLAVAVFYVAKQGAHFAIAKPAQEALFTRVGREAKYQAKNFIDTVVYRGGDALSAQSYRGFTALGLGPTEIAFVTIPIAAVWALTGLRLGGTVSGPNP
jgi:AAA family ATP:ADP antiporter